MVEFRTEPQGNVTEFADMTGVSEASILLRRVAEPRPVGDTVKAAITRAAKRVSKHMRQPMSPSRAEDIWRREARRLDSEEMDAIRAAAKADHKVEEARNALAEFDARIARLEALLVQDEDFFRPQVDAAVEALRGPDRPVDRD